MVDDGSTDRTLEIARGYGDKVKAVSLGANYGKGAAVRKGMLEAKGELRLFTDADLSTPIEEVEKLIEKINEGADICIGSRALDRSLIKERQPFYREYMGRIFNKFVQIFAFKGISDTQCGFKLFVKKAAETIFPSAVIDGFSFDVEILYLAKKNGLKIAQVPVVWINDKRSTVNPIVDSAKMFLELLKIKKIHG